MSQDTEFCRGEEDCPFCAIIAGDAPAIRIHETGDSLSLVPRTPGFEGHMMVIPKGHYQTLLDIPQSELSGVMEHTQKVAGVLHSVGFDGFNLVNANGEPAQQSVSHFHMHIIPRQTEDEIDIWAAENDLGVYDDPIYGKISDKI